MEYKIKHILATQLINDWSLKEMLDDIDRISILTIPTDIANYIQTKQWTQALTYFSSLEEDEKYDDERRLIALWIANRLRHKIRSEEEERIQKMLEKKEQEEEEQWRKEAEERNAANENAMEIRKKTHSQWTKSTQEECNQLLFDYVWENFPLLKNGYDRSIFSSALYSYRFDSKFDYYRLSTEARTKYDQAVAYVETEIRRLFDEFQKNNIEQWIVDLKKWMMEHGLKMYTKGTIISFFKDKKLKVSELTIETIRVQVNK